MAHRLIVPEFVKNVVSLNSTAKRLRRELADCRVVLKRCLAETGDTEVVDRWTGHCEVSIQNLNLEFGEHTSRILLRNTTVCSMRRRLPQSKSLV